MLRLILGRGRRPLWFCAALGLFAAAGCSRCLDRALLPARQPCQTCRAGRPIPFRPISPRRRTNACRLVAWHYRVRGEANVISASGPTLQHRFATARPGPSIWLARGRLEPVSDSVLHACRQFWLHLRAQFPALRTDRTGRHAERTQSRRRARLRVHASAANGAPGSARRPKRQRAHSDDQSVGHGTLSCQLFRRPLPQALAYRGGLQTTQTSALPGACHGFVVAGSGPGRCGKNRDRQFTGADRIDRADLRAVDRFNFADAHTALEPLLPSLLLLEKKVDKLLRKLLSLIAKQTYLHRENLSKPRKPGDKPHKPLTGKQC
jgi:hypothetical protein